MTILAAVLITWLTLAVVVAPLFGRAARLGDSQPTPGHAESAAARVGDGAWSDAA